MKIVGKEEINRVEKSYQAVFRSQLIACAVIDSEGMVKKVTKALLERFSLSIDQVREKPLAALLECSTLSDFFTEHKKRKEEQKSARATQGLIAVHSPRGMFLWNQVEITTLSDNEREEEYLLVFYDCTESYQAQMILESSLALSSDVFLFFDNRNCLLQCSEEAVRIFGLSSRIEALGMHYTTFFQNRLSLSMLGELFQTLAEGKSFTRDVAVKYKGSFEQYELQAFNVMVKSIKSGMAVSLRKRNTEETYLLGKQEKGYESRIKPYIEKIMGKQVDVWEKRNYTDLIKEARQAMATYDYMKSIEILAYVLTIAPSNEVVLLKQVRQEVMLFRYEQAIKMLDGFYK
ncbi:MAG: PAS domain-containing protein [bacterium]|nr:PAS domain-containing protein [bacterium]